MCLAGYASEFYKLRERERLPLVYLRRCGTLAGRIPVFAQVNLFHVSQSVKTAA